MTQPPGDRRRPPRNLSLAPAPGRSDSRRPAARRPRARDARRREQDEDLDAYVKKIVDSLPPLTEEQRDLLARIFRSRHRRK